MEIVNFVVDVLTLGFAAASGITALVIWLCWFFKNKNKKNVEDIKKRIAIYEEKLAMCNDETARMLLIEKIDSLKKSLPKNKLNKN